MARLKEKKILVIQNFNKRTTSLKFLANKPMYHHWRLILRRMLVYIYKYGSTFSNFNRKQLNGNVAT